MYLRRCTRTAYTASDITLRPHSVTRCVATVAPTQSTTSTVNTDITTTTTSSSTSASSNNSEERTFHWRPRWRYAFPFRSRSLADFLLVRDGGTACVIAHSYQHDTLPDLRVTLLPLRHFAHPAFFHQVDLLCSQHDSVLMEGRCPMLSAPYSTFVPPRPCAKRIRPLDHDDDEGWEPNEVAAFFQPFSWGVQDSANHTVIHAADRYDYEKLPWWCSIRFNLPLIGSFAREKHCLSMIYPLYANGYKSFAIPWGAMHMPIFHEMLRDNGFTLTGLSSLVLVNAVDGVVSEGEYLTLRRWQRRRARWEYYFYIVTSVAMFYFLFYRRLRLDPNEAKMRE